MFRLFEYFQLGSQPQDESERIHLGDGKFLNAEDVLEGHFHRLSSTTVPIQVTRDLTAAITVLAPGLTPLTELAEEVAHTVPLARPTPQFRQDLHKALEQTHRQHTAQRVLGTRPPATVEGTPWGMIVLFAMIVVTLLGALTYMQKRQHAAA